MIIRRMTAHFGNLKGDTLSLHEGMNVVCLPNESGKSTWCAFLRSMLYGIDSAQRERAGVKPDKTRYAPWSGEAMSGEMEIEYEGRAVTLSRRSPSRSAPMRDFSAVYTGTAESVEGLRGTDVGETLTGVGAAVFADSAFVAQAGLGVNGSVELEKRIAALVSTGEEHRSYSEAEEQLRAWQRKRRYKHSGAIPALEEEIAGLDRQLDALSDAAHEREKLERELRETTARAQSLRRELTQEEERQRLALLLDVTEQRKSCRAAENERDRAREEALSLREVLSGSPFAGKSEEEAVRAAEEDASLLETLHAAVKRPWPALLLALLAAAVGVFSALWWRPGLAVAFALLTAALVVLLLHRGHRKEYERMALAMLHRYGTDTPEAIRAKGRTYAEQAAAFRAAAEQVKVLTSRADQAQEQRRRAEEAFLTVPQLQRQTALFRSAEQEQLRLKETLSRLNGRFSALGDPLVLQTRRQELQERRNELQRQYDALDLALGQLSAANADMQQRFSPELGRRASAYMEALTGGRYDRLLFDRQLRARARRLGDGEDHELSYLSAGAADQLYLALRLAICDMVLPVEEGCPLILDDALVNFDEERMAKAMDLLCAIAEQRQVILFTCHEREEAYLRGRESNPDFS